MVGVKLLVADCNKLHGWDLRADTKAFSLAGTPHQVRLLLISAVLHVIFESV